MPDRAVHSPRLRSQIGPVPPSTPPPAAGAAPRRVRSLPHDLLEEASNRLGVIALVCALLWALGTILYRMVLANLGYSFHLQTPDLVAAGNSLFSIGLYFYTRRASRHPQFLLDLGLGYMVFTSFFLGVVLHWDKVPHDTVVLPQISWIGAQVLIFAALIPNSPGKMLVAGLLAVSMNPLGMLLAKSRGSWDFGPASNVLVMHYPDFLLVGVAVVISRVVTKLGEHISKAREMGSYRLVERLGMGGMGEVWRARHNMLARDAAIKLIQPEMMTRGCGSDALVLRRRFEQEANATAVLSSPHTVALYDFGVTQDGVFYYVMELLEGIDLDTLVKRYGFAALGADHRDGVVGRLQPAVDDEDPRTLLREADGGRPPVPDGLARRLPTADDDRDLALQPIPHDGEGSRGPRDGSGPQASPSGAEPGASRIEDVRHAVEPQLHLLARCATEGWRQLGEDRYRRAVVIDDEVDEDLGAEVFDRADPPDDRAFAEHDRLRAEADDHLPGRDVGQGHVVDDGHTGECRVTVLHRARRQVHGGAADEAGDEQVGRLVVERPRRGALLEGAVAQHRDAVAHGHRLDLIVRDVDGCDGEPSLELRHLCSRLHAQLGIEVRERFVHQVHLRTPHDRPAHRHALALATGEVLRFAVEVWVEVEDPCRLFDPLHPLRLGHALLLQREAHVLRHRELRVERVVLEDHRDVAIAWPRL